MRCAGTSQVGMAGGRRQSGAMREAWRTAGAGASPRFCAGCSHADVGKQGVVWRGRCLHARRGAERQHHVVTVSDGGCRGREMQGDLPAMSAACRMRMRVRHAAVGRGGAVWNDDRNRRWGLGDRRPRRASRQNRGEKRDPCGKPLGPSIQPIPGVHRKVLSVRAQYK